MACLSWGIFWASMSCFSKQKKFGLPNKICSILRTIVWLFDLLYCYNTDSLENFDRCNNIHSFDSSFSHRVKEQIYYQSPEYSMVCFGTALLIARNQKHILIFYLFRFKILILHLTKNLHELIVYQLRKYIISKLLPNIFSF